MKSDNPYLKEIEGTLIFHFRCINNYIDDFGRRKMQERKIPFDIDQLPVLMCVFLGENLTQQQIATFASRDKSSVKRTLSIFEKKGLIKVLPHENDKRKTIVQTTDAGNFIAEQVRQMIHEMENELFSFMTKKSKKELLQNLKNINEEILPEECME